MQILSGPLDNCISGKTAALSGKAEYAEVMRAFAQDFPDFTLREDVYRNIVPEILADHSQSKLDEAGQELAARWDAPFIITTSVKFFKSLFARRPTDCRKLHSIADSVVVFDEAQSLPPQLTYVRWSICAATPGHYMRS